MDTFIQQIINGLVLGSIYALVALGYTMVYGILGLINFAHASRLNVCPSSADRCATMVSCKPVRYACTAGRSTTIERIRYFVAAGGAPAVRTCGFRPRAR